MIASPTPDLTDASSIQDSSFESPGTSTMAPNSLFFPESPIKQEDNPDDSVIGGQLVITTQDHLEDLKQTIDVHLRPETDEEVRSEIEKTTFDDYWNRDAKIAKKPLLKLLLEDSDDAKMAWSLADEAKQEAKIALNKAKKEASSFDSISESADHDIKHTDTAAKQAIKWRLAYRYESHKQRADRLKKDHRGEVEAEVAQSKLLATKERNGRRLRLSAEAKEKKKKVAARKKQT